MSSNPGTKNEPFASLQNAVDAAKSQGFAALLVVMSPGNYGGPENIGLTLDIEVVITPTESSEQNVVFSCDNAPVALTTSQGFAVDTTHNVFTRVQFDRCQTAVQFNGNLLTRLSFANTDFTNFTRSAVNSTAAQFVSVSYCTFETDYAHNAIALNVSALDSTLAGEFTVLGSDFIGASVNARNYLSGKVTQVSMTNVFSTESPMNVVNQGDGRWYITSFTANNCMSSKNGGALQLKFLDVVYVVKSVFSNCFAANGGAISASTNLGVVGCEFNMCQANNLGGAIYVNGGEYFFESSTFTACKAQYGGGIDLEGNILESGYTGLIFTDNFANNGTSISCCKSSRNCELRSVDEFQITSIGGQGGSAVDCGKLQN